MFPCVFLGGECRRGKGLCHVCWIQFRLTREILFCEVLKMIGTLSGIVRAVARNRTLWRHGKQVRGYACPPGSMRLHENCLELEYRGTRMHLDYVWLRDHCRSAESFNIQTHQRNLDTGSIDLNIRPDHVQVEDDDLILTWPGGHTSKYSLSWLAENSYEGKKQSVVQPRILWNADIYKNSHVASSKWDAFMNSEDELKKFLQNYLLYGIAFVDDVPATIEATEAVTQRVSLIRETTYGRMWSFTSDFSRGDTAYSQLDLDRHTDTTYFQEPCGIQVFHCLKHEGTGGRNLLVDGFYAAKSLRKRSPEDFELLSHVPIKHEYLERTGSHQNHMIGFGPVLNVYPWNNELYMIRYNNFDRGVINTIPHDVVRRWYAAHRQLTSELRRAENEMWMKLTPGKVIFIDNWRVMHGREAFTGVRQVCGCYLSRDDILSKSRCLGLQV
ncbi:trimethyllysine dioxygenase, mitochondrial isoform X1 [Syngnathus typhle]|uniref:trimethyllysine dioxygenase, mitochondrial isoform X1 n=1 Tax=Syngnathus typhle TaxID=161592 RepID=UPI002A6A9DFA|nr:trimethyllysine dioxygenase, mitochondrial isoform X1 [Syngnathus typhle]